MEIFVAGRLNGFQTALAVCCVLLSFYGCRTVQTAFFILCWGSTQPALLQFAVGYKYPAYCCDVKSFGM